MPIWFDVDKEGLARLLARKAENSGVIGQAWLVYELLQNSWDTDAQNITCTLTPLRNVARYRLVVEDDASAGFADLSHSWTLFADSAKKGDPEKRGRFNLGEKLVLALCESAEIVSMSGSVRFDREGRHSGRKKKEVGTRFEAEVRLTRKEAEEVERAVALLIPPEHVCTLFNGHEIQQRPAFCTISTTLPTEIADETGVLRRRTRATQITLHKARADEPAFLYEMGIPVVELGAGDPYHVNVIQKIPLNLDRDNVSAAYLQKVRAVVLNGAYDLLKGEELSADWVNDAISSGSADFGALRHTTTERFGPNFVSRDLHDLEANNKAMSEGFTVIPGGALSKEAWAALREHKVIQPAGRLFPTNLKSTEATVLEERELTAGMRKLRDLVRMLGVSLLNVEPAVEFYKSEGATVLAQWGNDCLSFNVTHLGEEWFEHGYTVDQLDLSLHEFGHKFEGNHLSDKYYRALTRLGAELAWRCADDNRILRNYVW